MEEMFNQWIRSQFEGFGCKIENEAIDLLVATLPQNFDLISSEIEKICTFEFDTQEKLVTKDIVNKAIGYDSQFTPEDLLTAIVQHDGSRSMAILENLLYGESINEIYLLSIISNYFMDLLSFKTKGVASMESGILAGKYKIWGERQRFARKYHNLIQENKLRYSLLRILETDQKLKSSMLDSKALMVSLVKDLLDSDRIS